MTNALKPAKPKQTSAPDSRDWLDASLYPFVSRPFAIDGHTMRYVDEGSGRPILFVHGTPSWSFEWRHAIRTLSREHRCVAPDHLGFGLSDKPADAAYRPADHARRLQALVDALELRDLVLVVHDFGGPIGLPIALAQRQRVRSLVLVNTWMWSHGHESAVRRVSRLVGSPLGCFLYRWLNGSPRWLIPASFADRKKLTRSVHAHYMRPFATRHQRMAPWVLGVELAQSDPYYESLWTKRAALEHLPTSIVWGIRDVAFGQTYLETWQALFPRARVVKLDAGHFPQEEQPDAVTEAVRRMAET